jgi:hypothetical protein
MSPIKGLSREKTPLLREKYSIFLLVCSIVNARPRFYHLSAPVTSYSLGRHQR